MPISTVEIDTARARLAQFLEQTPLIPARSLSTPVRPVYLKNETVLPTGSFKVRGAIHALLSAVERTLVAEVVAASTGNHGAAVAYAAKIASVPSRIFVPAGANPVKVSRIRELGATVVEAGIDLSSAIDDASAYASSAGAFFLHDASNRDIPTGTATIGAEILEQLPTLDVAFVPMGDTALIRGVAASLKFSRRRVQVVGVVASGAPSYYLSWKSGTVVETAIADTIADGLAVRRPLAANVDAIRDLVDDVVVVDDASMLRAMSVLRTHEQIVAEPSGAAAVAGLLKQADRTGVTVALVTGGNVSPDVERLALQTAPVQNRRGSS